MCPDGAPIRDKHVGIGEEVVEIDEHRRQQDQPDPLPLSAREDPRERAGDGQVEAVVHEGLGPHEELGGIHPSVLLANRLRAVVC
jgi:hypothetical protein